MYIPGRWISNFVFDPLDYGTAAGKFTVFHATKSRDNPVSLPTTTMYRTSCGNRDYHRHQTEMNILNIF